MLIVALAKMEQSVAQNMMVTKFWFSLKFIPWNQKKTQELVVQFLIALLHNVDKLTTLAEIHFLAPTPVQVDKHATPITNARKNEQTVELKKRN